MSETFAFDVFELDTARFELRRAGQVQEVQPKVLRLMQYLIRHRERAVPVEELLRELWPEATVTAGSVKRAVLGARQVLGDKSEGSSSIRTVRGLGYQFTRDDVRVMAQAPAAVSGSNTRHFVGRDALLATLLSQLEAADAGRGGCVLLTGAPGIGKTRTAEHSSWRPNGVRSRSQLKPRRSHRKRRPSEPYSSALDRAPQENLAHAL